MKLNESGFRPPLCTYRLNWARRTSWGWWDDWDDTVLQTQDSKFEPCRSETGSWISSVYSTWNCVTPPWQLRAPIKLRLFRTCFVHKHYHDYVTQKSNLVDKLNSLKLRKRSLSIRHNFGKHSLSLKGSMSWQTTTYTLPCKAKMRCLYFKSKQAQYIMHHSTSSTCGVAVSKW